MAASKKPIMIKDHIHKIETTRKELFQEEEEKIRGPRGIILKGFLTEKQRINEYLKQRESEYSLINQNSNRNSIEENSQTNFKQPEMRYKARTDLERIFDVINDYSFGRVQKDIIDKQLKGLQLNVPEVQKTKKEDEIEYGKTRFDTDDMRNNDKSKISGKSELGGPKKQRFKRKLVDNSQAKKLMNEYHNKTHFKAATDFTLIRSPSPNERRKNSPFLERVKESDEFGIDFDIYSDEIQVQTDKKKMNLKKNPNKESYNEPFNFETLEKLRKIMSKQSINEIDENTEKGKKVTFEGVERGSFKNLFSRVKNIDFEDYINSKKKDDDEKITIDNEVFLKKDVDLITRKVLKRCNFFHSKNKNNNKSLRSGDGKLMITGGMSINQFNQKFNFEK